MGIRWTSTGAVGDTLSITLRRGNRSRVITQSTPNTGGFRWTLAPNLSTRDDYFITIASTTNPEIAGDSVGHFSITD